MAPLQEKIKVGRLVRKKTYAAAARKKNTNRPTLLILTGLE